MRLFLFFFVLVLPSLCLADRLGSLTANSQVMLSTQSAAGGDNLGNHISTMTLTLGSFGYTMVDSNSCLWQFSVNTAGAVVSTLLSCPTVATGRPCTTGIPIGLLLALTCP